MKYRLSLAISATLAFIMSSDAVAEQKAPYNYKGVYKGGGHISFAMTEPFLRKLAGVKSGFYLFEAAGAYGASGWTVDNIVGSAATDTCFPDPTLVVTLYNCGPDVSCASPVVIGSVDVVSAGSASLGSVVNPMIFSGDYVAWEIAIPSTNCGGTANFSATAQIHAN
jgi:hypothetical protein